MDIYIEEALQTESTDYRRVRDFMGNEKTVRLLHAAIGLGTESGELLDAIKKHLFYGQLLDTVNLTEELGDLCWYMAIAMDALGTTFEEVQAKNIAKLRTRYPRRFTDYDAEHRDLAAEFDALIK